MGYTVIAVPAYPVSSVYRPPRLAATARPRSRQSDDREFICGLCVVDCSTPREQLVVGVQGVFLDGRTNLNITSGMSLDG